MLHLERNSGDGDSRSDAAAPLRNGFYQQELEASLSVPEDKIDSGGGAELFLDFIENLPVGIAMIQVRDPDDARSWRLTACNAIARDVIGESLTDFLLTRVAESFPSRKKMEEVYKQVLVNQTIKRLYWVASGARGMRRTYSISAFAAPPKRLGLLMQDASGWEEMRNALAEQKRRGEVMSGAVKAFLWYGKPETLETTWVSSDAQQMLGYWPERWCSMPNFWLNHIHPDDRDMVRSRTLGCTDDEETKFDYRMRAADGRIVWLQAVLHVNYRGKANEELAGVMVDITARKLTEDAAHQLSGTLLRVQDEERRRIARGLHDSLGQYLSVLGMNVGTLLRTMNGMTTQQAQIFAETTDLVDTCLREVRTMSYLMHPPMLDEVGLVAALKWYAQGFSERSQIQVEIDAAEDGQRLPSAVEMAFFRITQEALTNIYRHSQSKTATIRLRGQDGIELEISDKGLGLNPNVKEGITSGSEDAKGVGIRGMRERMRELGGTLRVSSNGNGTVILARVPRTSSVFASGGGSEPSEKRQTGGATDGEESFTEFRKAHTISS